MADVIDKKLSLRRYFPAPFYQLRDGKGLAILLDAIGDELNNAGVQVDQARAQFLLATAAGPYLQRHGVNFDIAKPRGFNMTDARFRALIKTISNSPKNVEQIFERLLVILFSQASFDNGLVDVYSYRKNEIICEIDRNALITASSRILLGTTYIHRDPANAYTGLAQVSWNTTLAAPILAPDTTATLTSTVGVPAEGIAEIGTGPVIKGFVRSGSVLTFASRVGAAFPSGEAVRGPQTPDNYPSGYVFQGDQHVELVETIAAGATAVDVGTFPPDFAMSGVIYIGDPAGATFEAKAYVATTGPNRLTFEGTTAFNHVAGETAALPSIIRKVKTTLNQTVTAGSTMGPSGELTVVNSADFPLVRQAIKIDNGGNAPEVVPFISRKVGDNTKVLIDPDYVFKLDHAIGERVNLMARQTAPRYTGFDYPFYLNDTDALLATIFSILRRVKVTGVKINFIVTG